MNVLVTYGSKRGGTAEIASRIGETLRERGFTTDVLAARAVRNVGGYDAVVVGGSLYAYRWHHDARRFVLRHAVELRTMPVWFFSSGPLDDTPAHADIPPIPTVRELLDHVGALDHATFAGRLDPDAKGFVASAMARKHAGDFRDWDQIERWAREISRVLESGTSMRIRPAAKPLPSRLSIATQCAFVAALAFVGGFALLARPDGALMQYRHEMLAHTPFANFGVPGLLLLLLVAIPNAWAAILHARRSDGASFVSMSSGIVLGAWILVEAILLRGIHLVEAGFLLLAVSITTQSLREIRAMFPAPSAGVRTPSHA